MTAIAKVKLVQTAETLNKTDGVGQARTSAQIGVIHHDLNWRRVVGGAPAHGSVEWCGTFRLHRGVCRRRLPALVHPNRAIRWRWSRPKQTAAIKHKVATRGVGGLVAGQVFPALRETFPVRIELPFLAVP